MSDSIEVQNVSQILASLALSAALQQHFSPRAGESGERGGRGEAAAAAASATGR